MGRMKARSPFGILFLFGTLVSSLLCAPAHLGLDKSRSDCQNLQVGQQLTNKTASAPDLGSHESHPLARRKRQTVKQVRRPLASSKGRIVSAASNLNLDKNTLEAKLYGPWETLPAVYFRERRYTLCPQCDPVTQDKRNALDHLVEAVFRPEAGSGQEPYRFPVFVVEVKRPSALDEDNLRLKAVQQVYQRYTVMKDKFKTNFVYFIQAIGLNYAVFKAELQQDQTYKIIPDESQFELVNNKRIPPRSWWNSVMLKASNRTVACPLENLFRDLKLEIERFNRWKVHEQIVGFDQRKECARN